MGALSIRALGPLEVVVDGVQGTLAARQQRIVLECLALRANKVVTSDFLVEALWADSPPAKPGAQLQVYVANLRRLLDPDRAKGVSSPRLASRPGGYALAVGVEELDLLQFREHVQAGELAVEDGDLVGGADRLRQAVELFRGSAFPDLSDIELFRPELDELAETRFDVYQNLIEVELALGGHESLVGELQSLVAQQRYRERLWASLVLALYRSDRQADALAACREARQVFIEELGIDPSSRLQHLERSVLRQDPSLAAPPAQGHRRIRQRVVNLPAELTPLLGRDIELEEVCSLYDLNGLRMVTLTGPGGTGKTRLALAAARQLEPRMDDGVCWVDLAPLTQVHQVPAAIASALGLEDWGGGDALKAAGRFLRSRHLLLVLDNFEHLEEAWPHVVELLTVSQNLRILTTSRQPLGIRAEYEYALSPLALPPLDPPLAPQVLAEVPSVRLFLARGRAVRPQLDLNAKNAAAVARLCCRLDGLPLAIELAAAQLRYRREDELLNELEVSLAGLPAAFRDLPNRQRTLTATIEWSYQLLDPAERQLFDQIGVFAADPTVEAVGSICGAGFNEEASVEAVLAALVRHSLLRRYSDPSGTSRVTMLQSIREFARDRLAARDDATTVHRRHADVYLRMAESVSPQLWTQNQVDAFQLLHAEAADLRGALLWATGQDGSTDLALRLVGQLWHYWELTADVAEQCEIALKLVERTSDAPPALQGPALSGTATLCWMLGKNGEATELHERARQAFKDDGNEQGVAWSTACLALLSLERNDRASAERLATAALSFPSASIRAHIAALIVLGLSAFYAGDHARALELSRESVRLARPLADRALLGIVLTNLADSTEKAGDYDAAEQMLHEALATSLELGAKSNITGFLESLAGVYVQQNRAEQAVRVLGAVHSYRRDQGLALSSPEHRRIESIITNARALTGPVRFGLAWAGGQALTLTQIVDEVLQAKPCRNPHAESLAYIASTPDDTPESKRDASPWS